ncbi:MAG: class I SAM-dependent methyltransferase [Candidatus Thorarchaeota archaeon]
MDDKEDISVSAPEEWMGGWNRHYGDLLESQDEQLLDFVPPHPITRLQHAFKIEEIDAEEIEALELACGDGKSTCTLAKWGASVTAMDALDSAVKLSKKRAKIVGVSDRIRFLKGDIDSWPIGSSSYNVIVAIQILQYLFERAIPRLQEIKNGVRPGGFLVYSGNVEPHFETDPEIRFITETELTEILEGWKIHSIGKEEVLIREEDRRGYIWVVAQKPL